LSTAASLAFRAAVFVGPKASGDGAAWDAFSEAVPFAVAACAAAESVVAVAAAAGAPVASRAVAAPDAWASCLAELSTPPLVV
jgi:hypothetical protein